MENPLVSIIIACRNNSKYIRQCLESVIKQTYKNIEIIIVDNYSYDGTYEIAKEFTDKVYRLWPERSTQFNYWFTKSSGSIIYRIGAEFVLDTDVVKKWVDKIINWGYDALAIHNRSKWESIWAKVRFLEREAYKWSNSIVAVRFMRREVFEGVWMFNESLVMGEDFDLHNRIVESGYKWTHLDAIETHVWEPINIVDVWNKFYYYWRTFREYQKNNKKISKKQFVLFRPEFKSLQKELVRNPKLFIMFWIYNVIKLIAWVFGIVRWYPKNLRKNILKPSSIKCFVINLEKDKDRWKFISTQLDSLWIPYERFNAVYINDITLEEREQIYNRAAVVKKLWRDFTRWEIGCSLSHREIYKKIVSDKIPKTLILEDDIEITNVKEFVRIYSKLLYMDDWEYVMLNYDMFTPEFRKRYLENIHNSIIKYLLLGLMLLYRPIELIQLWIWRRNGSYILPVLRPLHLTWCYFVSLKWGKKLLDVFSDIRYPVDFLQNYTRFYKLLKLNFVVPQITNQKNETFNSNTRKE